MEADYNNPEVGCRAFVSWLVSQASASAAWEHIHEDDKRDLEKALSILADDPAEVLSAGNLTHEGLWRFLGAAFMIGRCGNFAESDVAYYQHVRRPADNREKKASKRAGDPAQRVITDVVAEMMKRWDGTQHWPLEPFPIDRNRCGIPESVLV